MPTKIIHMHGLTKIGLLTNIPAKTSDVGNIIAFSNKKSSVKVVNNGDNTVTLTTTKGSYILTKHATNNMYVGKLNGCKAHFICKKVIGKLIYWE